jgi:hypothetical protein
MGRCACIADKKIARMIRDWRPPEQTGSSCSSGGVGAGPGDEKWATSKTDVV